MTKPVGELTDRELVRLLNHTRDLAMRDRDPEALARLEALERQTGMTPDMYGQPPMDVHSILRNTG